MPESQKQAEAAAATSAAPDNEMAKLEARARQLAEEAVKDKPVEKGISFVRSDATEEELGEMVKTNNPEEINIDSDESDDEETVEEVEKQYVPSQVFGSLAKEEEEEETEAS